MMLLFGQASIDSTSQLYKAEQRLKQSRVTGDSASIAESLYYLARLQDHHFKTQDAIQSYQESIQWLDNLERLRKSYDARVRLAKLYRIEGLLDDAEKLLDQSYQFYKDKSMFHHMALAACHLAELKIEREKVDEGQALLDETSEVLLQSIDTGLMIQYSLSMVFLLDKTYQYEQAMRYLQQAYDYSLASNKALQYTQSLYYLGDINAKLGETEKAIAAFERARSMSAKLGDREKLKRIHFHLSKLYKDRGEYHLAYESLSRYTHLNDSLLNDRRQEIINRLSMRFESTKKELEILSLKSDARVAELKARRNRLAVYSALFGVLAVLVATFFIILFYQQRLRSKEIIQNQKEEINVQKIKELETNLELESMRSMIQGQEFERNRIAKDLHDSLGGLLSTIKLHFDAFFTRQKLDVAESEKGETINKLIDRACSEVRDISNNLQPGALQKLGLVDAVEDLINKYDHPRYPEINFQYYGLEDDVDSNIGLHVFRIIQELINNSIKHAKANDVLVQITRSTDELIVLVEDDGEGYDPLTVETGMGTDNVKSRVSFLKGELSVHTEHLHGTSTLIVVPIHTVKQGNVDPKKMTA